MRRQPAGRIRRPTAPLADLYGGGKQLRPKARPSETGSLARSAEGGAGALHRDQDKGGDRLTERLLLRTDEAARLLGLGRTKVFELLTAGELPVVRIGRAVRVPRGELERWIADRTTRPAEIRLNNG